MDIKMKSKRHSVILEIIENNDIETQEELIAALRNNGFNVTQATVSRDIRELKLTKSMSANSKYKYVASKGSADRDGDHVYSSTLAASVISIELAMNLVVIKTYPGMAQAVAAGIDSKDISGVMGCVAGDDTLFVATHSIEGAEAAAAEIKKTIGK